MAVFRLETAWWLLAEARRLLWPAQIGRVTLVSGLSRGAHCIEKGAVKLYCTKHKVETSNFVQSL